MTHLRSVFVFFPVPHLHVLLKITKVGGGVAIDSYTTLPTFRDIFYRAGTPQGVEQAWEGKLSEALIDWWSCVLLDQLSRKFHCVFYFDFQVRSFCVLLLLKAFIFHST